MKSLNDAQRKAIAKLIEVFVYQAERNRPDEVKAGKVMTNGPCARLMMYPQRGPHESLPMSNQEDIGVWTDKDGEMVPYRLTTSTTTFLTAHDEWNALEAVEKYLEGEGFDKREAIETLPRLFNFVYGVLMYMRLQKNAKEPLVLMGVRSQNLASRNLGMVSFPGGLVDNAERLEIAAPRELMEESGLKKFKVRPGFAFTDHNSAPSITFMCMADTTTSDIAPSIEWKGKHMVWVPETALYVALYTGNTSGLIRAFHEQGIEVPNNKLELAPDMVRPAKTLLRHHMALKDHQP
jgi:8-oxo-dGTP pyrophosphatase MutT (NUDIX family)